MTSNPPDAPQPPRRWWLRMLVASAALVAVLLGAVWITPAARLHYRAWRYRRGEDHEEYLPKLTDELLKMKASRARVTRLLGSPGNEWREPDGKLVLCYKVKTMTGSRSGPIPGSEAWRELIFRGGRLVKVRSILWGGYQHYLKDMEELERDLLPEG